MEKNVTLAVILSVVFMIFWWMFNKPAPSDEKRERMVSEELSTSITKEKTIEPKSAGLKEDGKETLYAVETSNYKAVFSNRGASVKSWEIKEKRNGLVNLVLPGDIRQLSTFSSLYYTLIKESPSEVIFEADTKTGYKIKKTYVLSNEYLHKLKISVKKLQSGAKPLPLVLSWGPGIGSDKAGEKDNVSLTRALAYTNTKPNKLEKIKDDSLDASEYGYFAVDNRYFLSALIPEKANMFSKAVIDRASKKEPPTLSLLKDADETGEYTVYFYLGPKIHSNLKSYGFGLEETLDFGFFGFLGKIALSTLNYFYSLTGNYGWAIILLTMSLQVLVFPLTLKSFKASADMKKLQPHIKEIQAKYKSDPQRLNVEMMNIYKTHKVNPLGGCLPMLLQLPIFWALFSTLRNAYELRGAAWIWWIKDLSAPDTLFSGLFGLPFSFGLLPLLMGAGMLLQQKMTSVSADPAQAKMMMMLPIVFTFLFMKFPAGLVLYWFTNSLLTMTEQYFILHKKDSKSIAGGTNG